MLTVGLTGNVAAGKTVVADHCARWGATVIDADRIVHDLQAPGTPVFRDIVARFGRGIVAADGGLDRAGLRRRVMADPAARADLNGIVHPAVQRERERLTDAARAGGDCIVIHVIPLLFEVLDPSSFDTVVLVDAPVPVRRRRLTGERGMPVEDADRLMASQLDAGEKRRRADHVIDNAGTLAELEAAAWTLWTGLRARAARDVTAGGTLLAVFAHPDDESFAAGGTLARYADAGVEIHVACATAGHAGTQHDAGDGAAVARRRTDDLHRAADLLGVDSVRLLGFGDGALRPDDGRGIESVRSVVAAVRPDVVITFGPEGVTGHADHVAVHAWTTRAWSAAGSPGRLYYVGYPAAVAERFPVPIRAMPDGDVSACIDVRPWADVKRAAIAAHTTQRPPFDLAGDAATGLFDREWYARPGHEGPRRSDLFAPAEHA